MIALDTQNSQRCSNAQSVNDFLKNWIWNTRNLYAHHMFLLKQNDRRGIVVLYQDLFDVLRSLLRAMAHQLTNLFLYTVSCIVWMVSTPTLECVEQSWWTMFLLIASRIYNVLLVVSNPQQQSIHMNFMHFDSRLQVPDSLYSASLTRHNYNFSMAVFLEIL